VDYTPAIDDTDSDNFDDLDKKSNLAIIENRGHNLGRAEIINTNSANGTSNNFKFNAINSHIENKNGPSSGLTQSLDADSQ
jgi:hypothetical protein